MATLNFSWGATIKVSNSTSYYVGANNQFFGGNSYDWIAMLRYNAPSALGVNEVLTAASFIGMFKADTAWDAATVTIGLIAGGWTDSTTNFNTLYSYITGVTTSAYISANGTETQLTLAITALLQAWAANPSAYSGIYFRCNSMELTRIGASGQSINTTVETRTACSAPTSVWLDAAMAAPGASVNLNWSGANPGTLNPIDGYIISRSEDGGAFNDSWAWDGASPVAVAAHSSYGHYYTYRIITDGQYIDSGVSGNVTLTTYTPTNCGAPANAGLSTSLAESAPTLTYSGASGGTINSITGYEIQYAESANGTSWGAWTALKTVSNTGDNGSTTVNLSGTRGYYRKYRIRTQGSAGASYYSAWTETGFCRKNSAPTSPTSFAASPAVYVGGEITLDYPGATDIDNNLETYYVAYELSDNGIDWYDGDWLDDGATSHTPTLTPGQYIRYWVAAVDDFGVESSYIVSNVCGKNTAPAAPVITYPQIGKTIYNSRPRFLLTMGADPESHTQSIAASGYAASTSAGLAAASKTILRRSSAASAGTVSVSAISTDLYGEASGAAARNTTYAVPSFTDATIAKGTTPVKAAHITELRTMINTVRAYYGLSAISWAETITAGVTKARNWASHVVEMQAAIDDIVALVNGWDTASTTNRVILPAWLTPGARPNAAVMEQIRTAIVLL